MRPLVSLIRKSEKARRKLTPGAWQHTMLRNNLQALRLARRRWTRAAGKAVRIKPDELSNALAALSSMIRKSRKAQAAFKPGTPQHTLQRNRLKALRTARAHLKAALARP